MGNLNTVQALALGVYEADAEASVGARVPQLFALGVYDGTEFSPYIGASQLFAQAVFEGVNSPGIQNVSVSQLFAQAVFGSGTPDDLRLVAWSFTMDGHKVYVIKIGEFGTFIYDMTTQKWSKWDTAGYPYWNNFLGFVWDGRILAADSQSSIIWEVDPEDWQDEGFKDIVHVVTAIIPATNRDWISLDEVYLEISSGFAEGASPRLTLEYSDDRGVTWETPEDGTVFMTEGDFREEFYWQALGSFQSPGRIIRITDVGGPIRIDSATMRLNGEE